MNAGNAPPEDCASGVRARRVWRDVDGILLVNKPTGLSSNQALQRVRRLFAARKAGHTGSLDPLASGMLPVCLGEATKMSAFLLEADKTYRVRISFGCSTSTGDAEGPVVDRGRSEVDQGALQAIIAGIRGAVMQVPPMYSALKYQGKRLYELARAGTEVPRSARMVKIHEIVLESYDPQCPVIRVRCGKGTYIRSLVEDIARQAGTVGHVAMLHRLCVEPFPEDRMTTIEDLERQASGGGLPALDRLLLPADWAIGSWDAVTLDSDLVRRLRNGQRVAGEATQPEGMVRIYGLNGGFVGIAQRLPGGWLAPRRIMAARQLPAERISDCN